MVKINGIAIWINEIGSIAERPFEVLKEKKEEKTLVIAFSKTEIYEIKRNYVRAKRVIIYKKSDGNIVVQNPDKIGQINLEAQGIKTLRFNLQNSALQESKAAIYRWTPSQDAIDKLTPIFKLLFICIAVGVIGWAAFKYGTVVLEVITRSRLLDCSQLFPSSPIPTAVTDIPVAAIQ